MPIDLSRRDVLAGLCAAPLLAVPLPEPQRELAGWYEQTISIDADGFTINLGSVYRKGLVLELLPKPETTGEVKVHLFRPPTKVIWIG